MIKTGSVTHSDDMDQRSLNLQFTRSGDTLTANLPTNVNETPPGYYMIFVLNAAGVPSEAKFVKINVAGTTPPPPPTTTNDDDHDDAPDHDDDHDDAPDHDDDHDDAPDHDDDHDDAPDHDDDHDDASAYGHERPDQRRVREQPGRRWHVGRRGRAPGLDEHR